MITFMLIFVTFTQIKSTPATDKVGIEIVTKKEETYDLLTKQKPLSFEIEGPTYLRVYTRIPWPSGADGHEMYKVILQENGVEERMISLESEVSKVTKDKLGRPLSKWRSFYIEVPEGKNSYKIIHWSSPKDTILVKLNYESPKKWQDVPATEYKTVVEAIEEEKLVKYYELRKDGSLTLGISGPVRLQVLTRLNYDEKMIGEQNYTVIAEDKGKEIKKAPLKCYKSEIVQYKNRKEIMPSNARSFFINLPEGWHDLKLRLSGTIAQSMAVRFLIEEK